MSDTLQLIKAIRAKCGEVNDEELVAVMDAVAKTKRERNRLRTLLECLADKYKTDCQGIKDQLSQVRRHCDHLITKYHPDPSGNNDSWTECEICGATL